MHICEDSCNILYAFVHAWKAHNKKLWKERREGGKEEKKSFLLHLWPGCITVPEPTLAKPISDCQWWVLEFGQPFLSTHPCDLPVTQAILDLHFPNRISLLNFRCGVQRLSWTSTSKRCLPSPSSALLSHLCWFLVLGLTTTTWPPGVDLGNNLTMYEHISQRITSDLPTTGTCPSDKLWY